MARGRAAVEMVWLLRPPASTLRRRSDRVETAVHRVAALVLLLLVASSPVASELAVSSASAATQATQAGARRVTARVASTSEMATIVDGAPDGSTSATVDWVEADASPHHATVMTALGVGTGDQVALWVEQDGATTVAPAAPADVAVLAVVVALAVSAGAVVAVGAAVLLARWLLGRARGRRWEADWVSFQQGPPAARPGSPPGRPGRAAVAPPPPRGTWFSPGAAAWPSPPVRPAGR